MQPGFLRTFALLAAMTAGALFPAAHVGEPLIRWLVMAMLFLVFLGVRFSRDSVQRSHLHLLLANVAIGYVAWGAGWIVGGRDVALAAFFAGITPTATAAAVVMGFLRGRADYVVTAMVLTNLAIAALFPLLLPPLIGHAIDNPIGHVAASVGLVVFLPLGLAVALRTAHPAAAEWPRRLAGLSFGLWVLALFLIVANSSHFLRVQPDLPWPTLARIAGTVAGVCALNFALGRLLGGARFAREASQALGQKNTTLTIYLALTYASPLVALGPTSYVVWHNLWNSWQLHRAARRGPPSA